MREAGAGSATSDQSSRFSRAELLLVRVVELSAATLLLVEAFALLAGVFARYVLNSPIIWIDEFASLVFVWLAGLGAVVALSRGQHMRLTAFVSRLNLRQRMVADLAVTAVIALFLLLIIYPAFEYSYDEAVVRTPALDISNSWRATAILASVSLMIVLTVLRILHHTPSVRLLTTMIVVVLVICVIFVAAKPLLIAMGNYNLILFFVIGILVMIFLAVPIAFAFGIMTITYIALITRAPMTVFVSRMDEGMSHLVLLSIPMFVLLGLLIEMTGMAKAMVNFLAALIGHIRGGLSYVLLGAMVLVSGISGAKAADMAAVAPVLFPEMKRRGAKPGELVSLLAASGAMAETIPPSLVLIVIGSVTGVSIAALFTGGLLPALFLAMVLAVVAYFRSADDDLSKVVRPDRRQIWAVFLISLPGLILPFVIRTAVVEGVATATEVSTIGIAYTVVVGLLYYREFDWRRVVPILVETASLSGAILLIIGTATSMAWALTQSGFSRHLAEVMAGLPGGATTFLAVTIVVMVVLGSVLEGIPALILLGPLLFPIARALGIHEVHYAIVVILAMGIGLFAPPFGVGFFTACAIGRVDPDEAMSRIWPYLGALLAGTIIVAAWPWLSIGFL